MENCNGNLSINLPIGKHIILIFINTIVGQFFQNKNTIFFNTCIRFCVKEAIVLTRADNLFIHNYLRSLLNNILKHI